MIVEREYKIKKDEGDISMSTNFYLRNKEEYEKSQEANKKIKSKIKEILKEMEPFIEDEEKIKRIEWELEENTTVGYEEIHIGKRSAGWKPSFEKQEQFSSVRELKDFYQNHQDKYEIVDEYGRVYDWETLVEGLIEWNPTGREELHDSYKDEDGYIWSNYEFS